LGLSDWLTHIHKLNQGVVLLLGVHGMAVFFCLIVKHKNPIQQMFTGCKRWYGQSEASGN
jgi:hypothetical protein